MTDQRQQFDPVEHALRAGILRAPIASDPSCMDMAAWMEAPDASADQIEAALASDPDLRSLAVAIRCGGLAVEHEVSPALHRRVHRLMPTRAPVLARIGGWAAAAAAAVLLALGGWHLGHDPGNSRALGTDTVAMAALGSHELQDQYSVMLLLPETAAP